MAKSLLGLLLLSASLSLSFHACAGIHLELTHVDAKDECTVEERMRRATERTHRRLASVGAAVSAPVHWSKTQYIAEYLIGDPPQRAEAMIDTGSNLVWTQCSACSSAGCFQQNLPYYEPSRSKSVHGVLCNQPACRLGNETGCMSDQKTCGILSSYGLGTIAGVLGTEMFTFSTEKVGLAFGCITATKITPGSLDGASGMIGLGRGGLSLVSQLGDTKFSYCLTPYLQDNIEPSHLFVGASATLGGRGPVTSVPFLKNPKDYPYNLFYYLPLTGITVGKVKLDVPAATFELREVEPGTWTGTLIDSGAPFTSLVDVAFLALRKELTRQLGASRLVRSPSKEYDLCVSRRDAGTVVPPLVLHFGSGGADLVVPPENYWGPIDAATSCLLVFNSGADKPTVIGNFMQQNMHLLYDLAKGTLSFQPADCTSI